MNVSKSGRSISKCFSLFFLEACLAGTVLGGFIAIVLSETVSFPEGSGRKFKVTVPSLEDIVEDILQFIRRNFQVRRKESF